MYDECGDEPLTLAVKGSHPEACAILVHLGAPLDMVINVSDPILLCMEFELCVDSIEVSVTATIPADCLGFVSAEIAINEDHTPGSRHWSRCSQAPGSTQLAGLRC